MYEIRQVIQRLRLGETDRGIARTQRVGRRTVARIRALAAGQNCWTRPVRYLMTA